MKHFPILLAALAAPAAAQNQLELPASATPSSELPTYSLFPFAYTNARVQLFFDATEVGATSFTATSISFRYDGPLPAVGAPGPFTIQRLEIRVGATAAAMPEARFASNLTAPLTLVHDASVTYFPDPGSASPHPWGAPNGSLTFAFTSPVTVTIPPGGWFVVDVAMTNNNFSLFGFAHTLVDAAGTTGGPVDGSAVGFGQGCGAGASAPPASIGSTGVRAPGAAYFVTGANLGANAPVFVIHGLDNTQSAFGPLPFQFPGTNCSLFVRPDATTLAAADGSGNLAAGAATAFAVPADPVFAGVVIHQQLASLMPGVNALGLVGSDALTVTLGSFAAPGRGTYLVGHSADPRGTVATDVKAMGVALRIGTL